MHFLQRTLTSPEENLALDEALLEAAEAMTRPCEILRLWESAAPLVVIGRSSRVSQEVDQAECERRGIPILRRSSGGAAIVAGPGCLMYAVVLSYELRPQLRMIEQAHQFVLGNLVAALQPLAPKIAIRGISDLAIGDRKVSGNSLRCKRSHLLYHGTLLYDFPLQLIGNCLKTPPRQPDYRAARSHDQFVGNLHVERQQVEQAMLDQWQTNQPLEVWPQARTKSLAAERYSQASWNLRL